MKRGIRPMDRRDSLRVPVSQAFAELRADDDMEMRLRVSDLSGSGAGLWVPPRAAQSILEKDVTMELGDLAPFRVHLQHNIAPIRPGEENWQRIGARLGIPNTKALGTLARFVAENFMDQPNNTVVAPISRAYTITEAPRILYALATFATGVGRLRIRDDQDREVGRARGLGLNPEGTHFMLDARGNVLRPDRPYTFDFSGRNAKYVFAAPVHPIDDVYLVAVPPALLKHGIRATARTEPVQPTQISLLHPRIDNKTLDKPVLDLSAHGLSFVFDPEFDGLFPGERVMFECGQGKVWAEGIIKSVSRRPVTDDLVCGMEIHRFPSRADADRWHALVLKAHHPSASMGNGQNVDEAWGLLESSKYLEETTAELEDYLADAYRKRWRSARQESRLNRYIFSEQDDRKVGTISASVICPQTWFIHHLALDEAMRSASREAKYQACYDTLGGIARVLQHEEDCKHVMVFFDATKRFNDLVYGQFLRGYTNKEDFEYRYITIHKTVPTARPIPEVDGVDVVMNDRGLALKLSDRLRDHVTDVEYEAWGYGPKTIQLEDFARVCEGRGWRRERRLLFANRNDGKPIAALIAEFGGEGTNIFSLLNSCRLIPMEEGLVIPPEVAELLLSHALQFYTEAGAQEALFVRNGTPESETSPSVLSDLGFSGPIAGIHWTADERVLPAWLDYLSDLFADLAENPTHKNA